MLLSSPLGNELLRATMPASRNPGKTKHSNLAALLELSLQGRRVVSILDRIAGLPTYGPRPEAFLKPSTGSVTAQAECNKG